MRRHVLTMLLGGALGLALCAPAAAQEPPAESADAAELRALRERLEALERRLEGAGEPAPIPAPSPADGEGAKPEGAGEGEPAPAEAAADEGAGEGLVLELPLSVKLKITGHLRLRGEWRDPRDYRAPGTFGRPASENADSDESFVFQRAWISFDFRVRKHVRAVVAVMDARLWGDQPIGGDASETFLREGYVALDELFDQPLEIKAGRMLVPALGDGRLLHSLDPWANVPRLWDGVQVTYEPEGWFLTGFGTNLREAQVQTPRGTTNDDFWLVGAYVSNRMVDKHELDAYFVWRHLADDLFRSEARFGNGNVARAGDRKDFTAGLRLRGEVGPAGYTGEVAFQWGDQAGDRVQAWAGAVKSWVKVPLGDQSLRFAGEYAYASGDEDPADGRNQTFDPIFPFAHFYHGHMDLVLWRNLHALSAQAAFQATDELSLHADGHVFWLDRRQDAWYQPGSVVRRNAPGRNERHLGQELDLYVQVKLWEKRLFVWAGYSHFWTGEVARNTGKAEGMDWWFAHVEFNF